MKIVVTGATGFIGAPLCRALREAGHAVTALTRRVEPAREILGEAEGGRVDRSTGSGPSAPAAATGADRSAPLPGIAVVAWDARAGGSWEAALDGAEGVINLAGEPLAAKAWTPRQKEILRESRVESTRALVGAIERAEQRPTVLVSGSAVGYYGPHGEETLTEESPPGDDFVARLTREWEEAAGAAEALGVRVVTLRTGVVLGEGGGALAKMVPPFRAFLGGPLGSGRQWVSWIHRDDEIGLARWALEEAGVRGAVNATAPHPVTMQEFARALGRALGRPSALPAPALALRALMGEMADIVLTGQRVLPTVAQSRGYTFRHPEIEAALKSIVR